MCQWVGWVVPWLALPELTPGLIQLEGQLGWSVEDDLVHTPEPLRFSLWPFTPQRDRLASIGGGLKVGFQERETGSLKASRPGTEGHTQTVTSALPIDQRESESTDSGVTQGHGYREVHFTGTIL